METNEQGATSQVETDLAKRAAQVLDLLMRYRNISSIGLARTLDCDPGTVRNKLSGRTMLHFGELADYAEALDVEPIAFLMEPADAVRHAIDRDQSETRRATDLNEMAPALDLRQLEPALA